MPDLASSIRARHPHVVGSLGDSRLLHTVISPHDCEVIELRLDALGSGSEVRRFAEGHRDSHQLLVTARHPDEGGLGGLSASARAARLEATLPLAQLLDLELRSLQDLGALWSEARERKILRIASWHEFERCPSPGELNDKLEAIRAGGADIAKLAFRIVEPSDLQTLVGVLRHGDGLPLAVMGMGPLAPVSRLLSAQLGSVLNYGYLGDAPTAPGQWPARFLKEAIGNVERLR